MVLMAKNLQEAKGEIEELKKQKFIDTEKHNKYVAETTAEIKNSELAA